ncbi:MAG: Nif3-like dinuclear metal center hexameric protein [Lunatimonas sp.]|uniref:Nif3-like dinuclear metal center hexameric protein n=1 Tax=Lunatimonas sp. TaxID=2060141 RepID=UPI00263AE418|nr:Nif3-like dinuclear metal center hexameric protein [Lunatimonas sp.]MCC5936304.1 Nif3-like dinuclear metal center hexameric protein [Lunatimonas sp.]
MNKRIGSREILGRREFISSTGKGVGALLIAPLSAAMPLQLATPVGTVQEVIDNILRYIPDAPFAKTVDVLVAGSGDQPVTGIVTTMFPTIEVIRATASAGANLIIAHETPFYNHQDATDWLQDDPVYQEKVRLLKEYKIAIWRFHDYWHRARPDGIILGNLIRLGWDRYYNPDRPRLIKFPKSIPLGTLVAHVKKGMRAQQVRVIGDLEQPCQSIYLAFGFMDSKMQIAAIRQYQPDLILSGETREWETVERVRDGRALGANTSLVVLGHEVSEDAGMAYAAQWIGERIAGIPVAHVPSGDPFMFH